VPDEWFVKHIDENGRVDEFKPTELTFSMRHKDAGDASYDVPLALPSMRWAFSGPKRTKYEIWNTGMGRPVTSGICSYINTKRGEEVLHVQGKTWLWYLQNRHYPFNPLLPNAYLGGTAADFQGIAYQQFGDVTTIAQELWDIIIDGSLPHSNPFGMSLQYIPITTQAPMRVELGDTQTLFDMYSDLSQVEPGFTFYDNYAREIVLVEGELFPEIARTDPSASIYIFDRNTPPTKFTDIEFENNGPDMTHILGLGSGSATRIGRAYGYEQSQAQFGRWDGIIEFPGTIDKDMLVAQTQREFSRGLYPHHGLPLTVNADAIPDFWTLFSPGWSVWINEDFESNHVHGASMITEIVAHISNQGDCLADLSLEEINERGRPGTEQG
jgi:hypothetical protein